jgi:hypothetical protein
LLGLVLGPLAENRLFLSTDNYGLAWMHRPGVIAIFALTLLGIFYPMIKSRREERARTEALSAEQKTAEAISQGGVRFGAATWFTLALIAVIGLALWQSRNFGFRAGLFPWVIGTPTLVLLLLQLGRDLLGKKKKAAAAFGETSEVEVDPRAVRQRTVAIILWTFGFFLAIWVLGFTYAVPLMLFLYLKLAGKESWLMSAAVTFGTWLFYWGLFEKMLNVPFTEGLLITLIKGGQ